jgi:hypothetical protein
MPDEELIECLVELGGVNVQDAATPEFYELFLSTIRADLKASDDYAPTDKAPLMCPIHICQGLYDQVIDRQATRGWLDVTVNTVEWREFNAGHFLFDEQKTFGYKTLNPYWPNYLCKHRRHPKGIMLMYELEKPLSNEYTGNELAVIGMAGRFPGAGDIDSYWKNLCQEIDSVTWPHVQNLKRQAN